MNIRVNSESIAFYNSSQNELYKINEVFHELLSKL